MADSGMSSIPGIGAMTDTLEFVKNLWGGMKIPGMAMPSLSVDDINKQITDLKAVEAWLNVNMNMLRSTIQALEVQSATLAALHSMSASMASLVPPNAMGAMGAMGSMGTAGSAGAASPQPNGPAQQPAANPNPFSSAYSFSTPTAERPTPPGSEAGASSSASASSATSAADASALAKPETIGMNSAATFANPAAWWNLLQDQFKQAVSAAVTADAKTEDAGKKGDSGGKGDGGGKGGKQQAAAADKPKAKPRAAPARKRAPKA